jgi:two-component system, NarL family, response regulator NreC
VLSDTPMRFPQHLNKIGERFTPRERQIPSLIGLGKTSKEIAVSRKVSTATIASHRESICRKLGIHSTAALIRYALAADRGVEQSA